jgi:AraC-like DNA-binding protein
MPSFASLRTLEVDSFEELNEVVVGTRRDVVQLERGRFAGAIVHATIGDLPADMATFNLGIRTRGGSSRDRIGIGMLMASSGPTMRSSYKSRPGDVLAMQPGGEHENRYFGGASILVVNASIADIEASFGTEARMSDPSRWWKNHFRGNPATIADAIPRLQSLLRRLGSVSLSAEAADYWKRAVLEAMTANIAAGMPSERNGPLPSALRIVRQVEEYLDTQPTDPVHISRICSHLHVSRRTLHRAFHEALGIGPIAYLRDRRLCAVHTALRMPGNAGRFAGYYRQLFGEFPSETRQRHRRHPDATQHSFVIDRPRLRNHDRTEQDGSPSLR